MAQFIDNNAMLITTTQTREDTLLRESERYKTACRYVKTTDYLDRNVLIAILDIKETEETKNK